MQLLNKKRARRICGKIIWGNSGCLGGSQIECVTGAENDKCIHRLQQRRTPLRSNYRREQPK